MIYKYSKSVVKLIKFVKKELESANNWTISKDIYNVHTLKHKILPLEVDMYSVVVKKMRLDITQKDYDKYFRNLINDICDTFEREKKEKTHAEMCEVLGI